MTDMRSRDARIYVAGHRGLVGSALMRHLGNAEAPYTNLITRTHAELDLTDQGLVKAFFQQEKPEFVFLAAAKAGGILANQTYPADYIQQNLAIQTNVIHESWRNGVKRLLFLGTSCIYPRDCPQPIKEEYLLTGPLEDTNRAYALAKIAGIEMCLAYNRQYGTQFLSVMPTNLYGPGDNYDIGTSHVLPALIRKCHEAKIAGMRAVEVWGTGQPRREFLHSDDLADACLFLMNLGDTEFEALLASGSRPPLVNIGWGKDLTITELVDLVKGVVGFEGDVLWDRSKPDGTPRKLLMVSRMKGLGWSPRISLKDGILDTYRQFLKTPVTTEAPRAKAIHRQ